MQNVTVSLLPPHSRAAVFFYTKVIGEKNGKRILVSLHKGEKEYRVIIINKKGNADTEPLKVKIPIQNVLEYVILGENFGLVEENDYFRIDEKEIDIIRTICSKNNVSLKALKRDIYRSGYEVVDLFKKRV